MLHVNLKQVLWMWLLFGLITGCTATSSNSLPAGPTAQNADKAVFAGERPGYKAPPFKTLAEFETTLKAAIERGELDPFWDTIVASGQMPLIFGDMAVFMYRGEADNVTWSADYAISDRTLLNMQGLRQGQTDLWVFRRQFPADARLSYRIILNKDTTILDPLNPYQSMEGSGPVSELRMPAYVPPEITIPRTNINQGILSDDLTIDSDALGYAVNYRVYTPFGYDQMQDLPVIYVTDGHEYARADLGSMVIVLDNLIADGAIEPVMAVFIDPRDPGTGQNRREREFIVNDDFDAFLTTELVPLIDATYPTSPSPDARAILGASYGGFHAAYVGIEYFDTFHLIGMQSPSFAKYWVVEGYEQSERLPLKIFMSVGTLGDVSIEVARHVRDILEAKGYPLLYIETNDGHAWGNYRALLDELLIYFFGTNKAP